MPHFPQLNGNTAETLAIVSCVNFCQTHTQEKKALLELHTANKAMHGPTLSFSLLTRVRYMRNERLC